MWILDHQITRGSLGAQLSVMRTGSHTSVSLFSPISGALVTPWSASRNRNPLSGVSSFIHNPEKCRQGQIKVVYSIFTIICHDLPLYPMDLLLKSSGAWHLGIAKLPILSAPMPETGESTQLGQQGIIETARECSLVQRPPALDNWTKMGITLWLCQNSY